MLKYNPLKYFEYEQVNREIKSQILAANPSELPTNPPKESNLVYKINEKINERISEADKHLNIAKELLIVRNNLYTPNTDSNSSHKTNKSLLKRLFTKIFINNKIKNLDHNLSHYPGGENYKDTCSMSDIEIHQRIYNNQLIEIEKKIMQDYKTLKKIQMENKDERSIEMYSDQKILEILKKVYGENKEVLEIINKIIIP